MFIKMLVFVVVCSLISLTRAFSQCTSTKTFCVFSSLDDSGDNVIFTIHSTQAGWVGIGIGGSSMPKTDMYIGWRNSTGGYTISQRLGSDDAAPTLSKTQAFTQIPLAVKVSDSSIKLAFSFSRPRTSVSNIVPGTPLDYLYAFGTSPPSKIDDPSSSFTQHSDYGISQADFATAETKISTNSIVEQSRTEPVLSNISKTTVNLIHGVIMFIAWAVAPFVGIFIARFMKDVMGVWWYRVHLAIMLLITGIGSLAALIFMSLYSSGPHFVGDPHKTIGLLVCILMLIQVLLGFISNAKWTPDRTSIPWFDKAHWYLGRSSVILGIINCYLGLVLFQAQTVYIIVFWVWIGVGFLILLAGQLKFGQINHMVKDGYERKSSFFEKSDPNDLKSISLGRPIRIDHLGGEKASKEDTISLHRNLTLNKNFSTESSSEDNNTLYSNSSMARNGFSRKDSDVDLYTTFPNNIMKELPFTPQGRRPSEPTASTYSLPYHAIQQERRPSEPAAYMSSSNYPAVPQTRRPSEPPTSTHPSNYPAVPQTRRPSEPATSTHPSNYPVIPQRRPSLPANQFNDRLLNGDGGPLKISSIKKANAQAGTTIQIPPRRNTLKNLKE